MRVGSMWGAAAAAALALASLSACDQKLASQPARDHRSVEDAVAAPAGVTAVGGGGALASASSAAAADAPQPVKLVEGKPMWADNRRHSAADNAEYQFEHHGKELGARNLDDFLVKAHHFVNAPPAGTLTLTRGNGDKLLYDPKTGLFGVVRSDGAPRTVTHPAEGQAFWDKQVEENRNGGSTYRRSGARDEQG
jgi:hypothetical protein